MIINNQYILQRIDALLAEKFSQKQEKGFCFSLKFNLPLWRVRNFLYKYPIGNFLIRFYCRFMHRKTIQMNEGINMSIDFVRYCLNNDISLNTNMIHRGGVYVQKHIDDRLKAVFWESYSRPMTETEKEYDKLNLRLHSSIRYRNGFYQLDYEGKPYFLLRNNFEADIFIYHYGLKNLPNINIAGKDFLDIGACIGDTAQVLLEYKPKRIFAYEPIEENYKDLVKTIAKAGAEDKIFPIKKGLADQEKTMDMSVVGCCSTLNEALNANNDRKVQVTITTIDAECKDRSIGLIKMDIEGFEYFAVKGGIETIKRDKPVLLISIYHTGKDFFEIPPMIKRAVPEYKLDIIDTCPINIGQKILICYT
jgi:FkbM family methyltransferase